MSPSEILQTVVVGLFAVAFGLWARRLDKALDLLEKIQVQMWRRAIRTERRLTHLEVKNNIHPPTEDDEELTPV